jgi:uncharacterized protein YneF (UPF0154 family)
MNRKQYILLLVIAIIGGVIGGALSSKVLINKKAFAKDKAKRKIIEANEFRVMDEEGNIQAQLREGSFGAYLSFLKIRKDIVDKIGTNELYNHVMKDNPSYVYLDNTGLTCKGKKYCSLVSKNGFSFTERLATPSSVPLLHIGDTSLYWFGFRGDYPGFQLVDREKSCRLLITLHASGEPYIELKDDLLHSRAVLGHAELTDKTKSTIIRHASSLILFDKDGNVIWSAP